MNFPEFKKQSSQYKTGLESFLENVLEKYCGVEMITIDVEIAKDKSCFEILYQAHILDNRKKSVEQSWVVDESTVYLQPDRDLLQRILLGDEIYSIRYQLINPESSLVFFFPLEIK